MKLHQTLANIAEIPKPNVQYGRGLQKGQSFVGRVISFENGILDIVTVDALNIKASTEDGVTLPLNTPIKFQVVENSGDRLFLKPFIPDMGKVVRAEDIMAGFLDSIGIKPDAQNVNFLKNGGFIFGKNIEKLISMLERDGKGDAAQTLRSLMVEPKDLAQYIKEYGMERGKKLLEGLGEALKNIRNNESGSTIYANISGNIIKGLMVQVNHGFPLFFIPVSMYIENKFYNGEIWIEKDDSGGKNDGDELCIYLMIDTPSFGRIEANIQSSGRDLALYIYCKNEIMPIARANSEELKKHISSLGVDIKNFSVSELKESRNFMDLVKKYVKPFAPMDVRV